MSAFQTDALNPSALPTSTLGRRRAAPTRSAFDATADAPVNTSEAIRERFHEEWNVRIDKEVRAVAGGLKDLVDLADIGTDPSAHGAIPRSLHLRMRTAQLIRATQNLRDMAHELRLMLLLSDENDAARRRDAEMVMVRKEVDAARRDVAHAAKQLLSGEAVSESPLQPGASTAVNDIAEGGSRQDGVVHLGDRGQGEPEEDEDEFEEV